MKIIIIIECAEQQLWTQGYIQIAGECNFEQVANPNIKSLFRMHLAKLSSAGAACIHTHTYIHTKVTIWFITALCRALRLVLYTHAYIHTYVCSHMYPLTCTCVRVWVWESCALCRSLGCWLLRPKIVHEIMAESAMCHILGHLWVRF